MSLHVSFLASHARFTPGKCATANDFAVVARFPKIIAPIPARIRSTPDDLPLVRDSVGSLPNAKVISDLKFNNGFLSPLRAR